MIPSLRKELILFDKNTLFAFLLIAVILIFTPYYQNYINPHSEKATPATEAVQTEAAGTNTASPVTSTAAVVSDARVMPAPKTIPAPSTIADTPRRVVIDTKKYYLTLSNLGGGTIVGYEFKDYLLNNQRVSLIPENAQGNLGLSYTNEDGDPVDFDDIAFFSKLLDASAPDTIHVSDRLEMNFTLAPDAGHLIKKSFIFYADKYDFSLSVDLQGYQNEFASDEYTLNWKSGFLVTESRAREDLNYSYLYTRVGKEIINLTLKDKPQETSMTGDVMWASTRSKYFTAALIPVSGPGKSINLSGIKSDHDRQSEIRLNMPFQNGSMQQDKYTILIGPLDDAFLESYGLNLEKMMNWGWKVIQPISFAVLYVIKFLHRFISNYGIVLIIFTFIIKLILYPLTHKSYESMKKMQEIQPFIKEIQDKYKNNPEMMNKEVMGAYKKYGVNPMGGCLPTLIQMPLLYGLFIVFRTTIEFRGAPFMLWITDLSNPDVIYHLPFNIPLYGNGISVFPVIMGVSMYLQQRLSGSSQPNQQMKMMQYFMPLFMILLFNNFPSGLNIYYALFNILTIIQQKYFINPSIQPVAAIQEKSARRK